MTLDEAIKHCLEVADDMETKANTYGIQKTYLPNSQKPVNCLSCATEHRQLAEWLTDYKGLRAEIIDLRLYVQMLEEYREKAKRLLKAAVPIINNTFPEVGSCWGCANHDEAKDECKGGAFAECSEVCKWEHADEALALIGEDTNVPASADDTNDGGKTGSWISCKDRLPEPGTMVIVASYGSDIVIPEDGETVEECCERLKQECVRVTLGFIGSDGWYGSDYFPLIVTPSFWQPLPEPPKDGERE